MHDTISPSFSYLCLARQNSAHDLTAVTGRGVYYRKPTITASTVWFDGFKESYESCLEPPSITFFDSPDVFGTLPLMNRVWRRTLTYSFLRIKCSFVDDSIRSACRFPVRMIFIKTLKAEKMVHFWLCIYKYI